MKKNLLNSLFRPANIKKPLYVCLVTIMLLLFPTPALNAASISEKENDTLLKACEVWLKTMRSLKFYNRAEFPDRPNPLFDFFFYYGFDGKAKKVSFPAWKEIAVEQRDPSHGRKKYILVRDGSMQEKINSELIQTKLQILSPHTITAHIERQLASDKKYRKMVQKRDAREITPAKRIARTTVTRKFKYILKDCSYEGLRGKKLIRQVRGNVPVITGLFSNGNHLHKVKHVDEPDWIYAAFEFQLNPQTRLLFTFDTHNHPRYYFEPGHFPSEAEVDAAMKAAAKILKDHFSGPEPPKLQRITAEQKHISFNEARIKVTAQASYNTLGKYSPSDIEFTARLGDHSKSYTMASNRIKVNGNTLEFDYIFTDIAPGNYTLRITIKDERFNSAASSSIAYQDTLSLSGRIKVSRPVAAIVGINELAGVYGRSGNPGFVTVHRIEPSTATGGITENRKGPVSKGTSQVNALKDVFPQFWEDNWSAKRGKGTYHEANSPFLYSGDRIFLAGESLVTARILWENGTMGMAMFDGQRRANANLSGEFTIGSTRGESGGWSKVWSELWQNMGKEGEALFEQKIADKKKAAVEWLLKRGLKIEPGSTEDKIYEQTKQVLSGNIPDSIKKIIQPSSRMMRLKLSLFFSLFEAAAGDTVYSDVFFVQLNSLVYIRPKTGNNFEIYTLEGSPEIFSDGGKSKIALAPGQMVSITPGQKPQPKAYKPADLDRWWEEAHKRAKQNIKQGKDAIPVLKANTTSLKFYEQGTEEIPHEQRVYKNQFSKQDSRRICWELNLEYPAIEQKRVDFDIIAKYYNPDGTLRAEYPMACYAEAGWETSWYSGYHGWDKPGNWKPGEYRVDIFYKDRKIASDYFEITESPGSSSKQYDVPSLKANVTKLNFFEKGAEKLPYEKREYTNVFSKRDSHYIHWELNLEFPAPSKQREFEIIAEYTKEDGSLFKRHTKSASIKKDWNSSWHSYGTGWETPGKWKPGKYRVDLFIEGTKIASGDFEIQ